MTDINEISLKTKINAYAQRSSYDYDDDGVEFDKAQKIGKNILDKHGKDALDHAEKHFDSYTYGRKDASGKTKSDTGDSLKKSSMLNQRLRKDGKINKQDTNSLKNVIKGRSKLPESYELSEEELQEAVELEEAMAHGEARHADNDWAHSGSAPRAKVSKYHIKHKTSGKVLSTHTSAPEAVRTRAKLKGGADAYSIIKEEVMSQTYDLISAMESGKSVDMQSTFNEIMSQKITDAVDSYREQIAGNLFKTESVEELDEDELEEAQRYAKETGKKYSDQTGQYKGGKNYDPLAAKEMAKKLFKPVVKEAVVPGSVKKDKEGNITSVKTEPDAAAEARKKQLKANIGKKAAYIATLRAHGGYVYGDKK